MLKRWELAQALIRSLMAQGSSRIISNLVTIIALSFVIACASPAVAPTATPRPNPTRVATVSPRPTATPRLAVGDQGVLFISDEINLVEVAVDQKALDELVKAAVAKDMIGYAAVFTSGRAYRTPKNTKVLVIDTGFTSTQVRILEGEHFGRVGHVPFEWVCRTTN